MEYFCQIMLLSLWDEGLKFIHISRKSQIIICRDTTLCEFAKRIQINCRNDYVGINKMRRKKRRKHLQIKAFTIVTISLSPIRPHLCFSKTFTKRNSRDLVVHKVDLKNLKKEGERAFHMKLNYTENVMYFIAQSFQVYFVGY